MPITTQPMIDPKGDKGGLIDDPDTWWVVLVGRVRRE